MITHVMVRNLLVFVALFVGGSLLLVRLAVGLAQTLPLLAEHLANLACLAVRHGSVASGAEQVLTERDARVILADLVAVVVGEEHVGRQATLGRVGI